VNLEIHDNTTDEGGTLIGVARNLDYMYQAEQWVIDSKDERRVARFVLFSGPMTPIREWRMVNGEPSDVPITPGTVADPRTFARETTDRTCRG